MNTISYDQREERTSSALQYMKPPKSAKNGKKQMPQMFGGQTEYQHKKKITDLNQKITKEQKQ